MGNPMTQLMIGPQNFGWMEMTIVLVIGLLLFGRRLPEVGRSLGKGIVEFKRGLKDIGDDIESESNKPARESLATDTTTPIDPPMSGGEDVRVSRSDNVD